MSKSGDNSSFAEIARQVAEALSRDESRKQRVLAQLPNIRFAHDAAELALMSGHELAVRALKELGLKVPTDSDPLEALDYYLVGRRSAMDEGTNVPDFLEKYLKS